MNTKKHSKKYNKIRNTKVKNTKVKNTKLKNKSKKRILNGGNYNQHVLTNTLCNNFNENEPYSLKPIIKEMCKLNIKSYSSNSNYNFNLNNDNYDLTSENDTNNYNYGCFEGCYNKKNDVLLHIFILFVIIFMLSLLPYIYLCIKMGFIYLKTVTSRHLNCFKNCLNEKIKNVK